jgi:betaine/carnitine transporter, BCCT family
LGESTAEATAAARDPRASPDQNRRFWGMDIHYPVFPASALLAIAVVAATLLFRRQAAVFFTELRSWITLTFEGFFLASVNVFLVLCLVIACSPFGRIRLGGRDARPAYRYSSWLAMLFAAGVGIGLMFYGVLEPVAHMLRPPLGIDPGDVEAARAAGMAAAVFHWGLHAWAIYAVVGLSLALFSFNRGMPLTLRSAFHPLFGAAVWGPLGHVVDVVAVLAALFGLAVSLGLGAEQIAGGLHYLFGTPNTHAVHVALIAAMTGAALASVVAGLDRGIRRLSELNLLMAAALWLFILIAGPTLVIVSSIGTAAVDYVRHLPRLSNWIGRPDGQFLHDWTVFYWAWWISWSPFVGMFVARISYGRTVREFITWVLIVPSLISLLWMAALGGTAVEQFVADGYTGVAESVPELALFRMLEGLPLTAVVSSFCVPLIAIFFVTSADSGALVMDGITAGGRMDTPVRQRAFWCLMTGLAATALLLGGGIASLQAMTISVSLPFAVLLLLMCVGLLRGLRQEFATGNYRRA